MSKVKQRMIEIVNSLPKDYFDDMTYNEIILKLNNEYFKKYGKDETTMNLKNNTLYDIIYELFFFKALEESKEDIKNGRVITLEELNKEMEAVYESYSNK